MGGELIDDGAARISQSQQLCHFVEGLTGGVIAGVTDILVRPVLFLCSAR